MFSIIEKVLAIIFPKSKLVLDQEHMGVVLNYHKRISRCANLQDDEVGSSASGPNKARFICDRPGRYVGNGHQVTWTLSGRQA